MSHFTTVRTRLTERPYLVTALKDLGWQVEEGAVTVRGFQGATTPAEVKVASGVAGYDLGFRKESGAYELVADWWGLKSFDREAFLSKLTQRYALRVAKDQLEKEAFSLVEEVVEKDGTVRLTVRRMA